MKYLIISAVVTDKIKFPDKPEIVTVGGGAGWYAYAGAKVWTDDVKVVTGIGEDFLCLHKNWFKNNNVDTSGLIVRDKHSPITNIHYFPEGGREETPVQGLEHFIKLEARPGDIENNCKNSKGLYVFKNLEDMDFWENVIELKKQFHFTLMWEIAADAAIPENINKFESVIKAVDILSINRGEGAALFETSSEASVLTRLQEYSIPLTYYRKGSQGALLVSDKSIVPIPSIHEFKRVDPTGAGNSSSSAILVGYCEKKNLYETGLMGSISAGYMITQYGPITHINSTLQSEAELMLKKYASEFADKTHQ